MRPRRVHRPPDVARESDRAVTSLRVSSSKSAVSKIILPSICTPCPAKKKSAISASFARAAKSGERPCHRRAVRIGQNLGLEPERPQRLRKRDGVVRRIPKGESCVAVARVSDQQRHPFRGENGLGDQQCNE